MRLALRRLGPRRCREDFAHDAGGAAVGDVLGAAVGVVGQARVVQAELVQDRGLEVVRGDDIVGGAVADLVGAAVGHAALDSAAGEPDREALAVVVSARVVVEGSLADREPADLAAPVDERGVQKAAACFRSATSAAAGRSVRRQISGSVFLMAAVVVPRLAAQEELDEADTTLDQPPRDRAAGAVLAGGVLVQAVEPLDVLGARPRRRARSLAAVCMAAASS